MATAMVEIVTLFAVLATGLQEVEVRVDDRVAAVELVLDGERAADLGGSPWHGVVDLGADLLPHELVAVARDGDGRELGRAQRAINRPTGSGASPRPDEPPAAEAGAGEVTFVVDPAVVSPIQALYEERHRQLAEAGFPQPEVAIRLQLPLGEGRRAVLVGTSAAEALPDEGTEYALFANSPPFPDVGRALSQILAQFRSPPQPERIADAVAVAGWRAAAVRPSAVVLVVAPETSDGSLFTAFEARRYLAALEVPFFVWTPAADPGQLADVWGEVESVASWELFAAAADRLRGVLDAGAEGGP